MEQFESRFSFLSGLYPEWKGRVIMVTIFKLLRNCLFYTMSAPDTPKSFCIPTNSTPISRFAHQHLLFCFLITTILQGEKGCLVAILICISIITRDAVHPRWPMHLLAICVSSLEKCVFVSFVHLGCFVFSLSCSTWHLWQHNACTFLLSVAGGWGRGGLLQDRGMSTSSVHCCVPFVSGSAPSTQQVLNKGLLDMNEWVALYSGSGILVKFEISNLEKVSKVTHSCYIQNLRVTEVNVA